LANIGCPIKGDLKYGAPRSNDDGSISLHAYSIAFEHPVTHEHIVIKAPCPTIEKMFKIQ
jgi:23S rRNA pseudouridine1911/1915/1917 synthase